MESRHVRTPEQSRHLDCVGERTSQDQGQRERRGASSSSPHCARGRWTISEWHPIELNIGYDEDPTLRPAVEALLATQYGAPRVDATLGPIVHTYEGEGVTVELRIHERQEALVIEVERTSPP